MQDKAAAFKATELDSELERELDTKATALFERVAQCNAEIRTSDEESPAHSDASDGQVSRSDSGYATDPPSADSTVQRPDAVAGSSRKPTLRDPFNSASESDDSVVQPRRRIKKPRAQSMPKSQKKKPRKRRRASSDEAYEAETEADEMQRVPVQPRPSAVITPQGRQSKEVRRLEDYNARGKREEKWDIDARLSGVQPDKASFRNISVTLDECGENAGRDDHSSKATPVTTLTAMTLTATNSQELYNPWTIMRTKKKYAKKTRNPPLVLSKDKFNGKITIIVTSKLPKHQFSYNTAFQVVEYIQLMLTKKYEHARNFLDGDWEDVRDKFEPALKTTKTLLYVYFEDFLVEKRTVDGAEAESVRNVVLWGRGLPEHFEETGLSIQSFIGNYHSVVKYGIEVERVDPTYLPWYLFARDIYVRDVQPIQSFWPGYPPFPMDEEPAPKQEPQKLTLPVRQSGRRLGVIIDGKTSPSSLDSECGANSNPNTSPGDTSASSHERDNEANSDPSIVDGVEEDAPALGHDSESDANTDTDTVSDDNDDECYAPSSTTISKMSISYLVNVDGTDDDDAEIPDSEAETEILSPQRRIIQRRTTIQDDLLALGISPDPDSAMVPPESWSQGVSSRTLELPDGRNDTEVQHGSKKKVTWHSDFDFVVDQKISREEAEASDDDFGALDYPSTPDVLDSEQATDIEVDSEELDEDDDEGRGGYDSEIEENNEPQFRMVHTPTSRAMLGSHRRQLTVRTHQMPPPKYDIQPSIELASPPSRSGGVRKRVFRLAESTRESELVIRKNSRKDSARPSTADDNDPRLFHAAAREVASLLLRPSDDTISPITPVFSDHSGINLNRYPETKSSVPTKQSDNANQQSTAAKDIVSYESAFGSLPDLTSVEHALGREDLIEQSRGRKRAIAASDPAEVLRRKMRKASATRKTMFVGRDGRAEATDVGMFVSPNKRGGSVANPGRRVMSNGEAIVEARESTPVHTPLEPQSKEHSPAAMVESLVHPESPSQKVRRRFTLEEYREKKLRDELERDRIAGLQWRAEVERGLQR